MDVDQVADCRRHGPASLRGTLTTMDVDQVAGVLDACERTLALGERVDLRELGFWRAVAAVKRQPGWVDRYAERIGNIDRRAFQQAVSPTYPLTPGALALSAGATTGVLLAVASAGVPRRWKGPVLLTGAGMLLATTHDLAHLLVGRAVGLRFTHWFLDGPTRLQPGLKLDYASYVRTPTRARAWMHASGALVTKVIPFALLPLAASAGAPRWTSTVLGGIGLLQLLTDALFSFSQSDWKRFRREMRVARDLAG